MKSISRVKLFTVLLVSICTFFLISPDANADGNIAVSGSFSTYEYKVVQGETVDSPLVNVIFMNNTDENIKLQIFSDTPDGVIIHLNDDIVTVQPDGRINIPIVISVSDDALPGEYEIFVKARLIEDFIEGQINVAKEFSLKTKLTIFGEAADLDINVVDIAGNPIRAVMNLYQIVDTTKTPLSYSDLGHMVERVIPGDYEVIAFWNDYQLVRHNFSVVSEQQYTHTLVAETVQIYAFTVSPVFVENTTDELATADIRFILHNIYEEMEDSRVVMMVYKNGNLVEERDIFIYDSLEVNRHELGLHYVPAQGWDLAEYRFELKFYADEQDENGNVINSSLYASSLPSTLDVSSGFSFREIGDLANGRLVIYVLIAAAIAGLFFLIKNLLGKKPPVQAPLQTPSAPTAPAPVVSKGACPDCNGKEIIDCPVCGGTGSTLYGGIKEECLYCNGAGKVMCGTCVDPKHLAVCPKCNGNGHTDLNGSKVECTYCNGLGHVVTRQYAKYIDGVKLKLGKKNR